jgi:Tfp pilus assembly protein PilV
MRTAPAIAARHGISLLEVLISMGILTVGLLSVLSLVPAGKSQAVKAVIYDRSSVMASNVAADLISRGLLRPASWGTPLSSTFAVFDPLYTGPTTVWPPAGTAIALKADAATTGASVLRYPGANAAGQMLAVCDVLFRSEDDPLYTLDGVGPDDPPLPRWSAGSAAAPNGRRSFEGLYSFLATLQTSAVVASFLDPDAPATPVTLTIVTFQRRDPTSEPIVFTPDSQTATDGSWAYTAATLPSGQAIKDIVKPGTMVLWLDNLANPTAVRWHRVVLAAEPQAGRVGFTCEGQDPSPSNGRVLAFPGAVGGIEMPVKLEGTSAWNR